MDERSYDPKTVEARWQEAWQRTRLYEVDLDHAERPFYNLMEFPYPSGEGLHVGHTYSFGGADSYGRFQRMRGHDVFQPMGFDAFGIHAENYALRLGINPAELVPRNVRRFREEQLKRMGAAFSWDHEVNTTDPRYYRWTQWIFLQLYKGGLAYRAPSAVNWCPSCLTTLADEQVIGGRCERCDTPVTQRILTQWFLRITRYAEELLDFSHGNYSETTQSLQRHWIGRREGAEIDFAIEGTDERITVFSTRPDTLFGATFVALAPEHPAALRLADATHAAEVGAYVEAATSRSEIERLAMTGAKTGVYTGAEAINPVNGRRLPVWVADYVLLGFGTGAIFGTPAHDQRDWEFAKAHGLPILPVVAPPEGVVDDVVRQGAYEGDGTLINSGPYSGLTVDGAKAAIVRDLERHGQGRPQVTYRLRDWLISRQRYWGPPIPIVYCDRCGEVPVPEDNLPVLLPETEHFRPLGTGESPLASIPEFVHTTCPRCGGPARRETDVSDNFLDSAWYYLRYTSTEFDDRPWDDARLRRWLPVSMYVGGVEHSTLHHLYARFTWKALRDLGHIPRELGPEPFARLRLHGLVIREGRRMSKSRGNVVNPDAYIARYGADVLRMNLLFMGRFEEGGDFSDAGITGLVRFTQRVWRLAAEPEGDADGTSAEELAAAMPLVRAMHQTVRKVSEDMEAMAFNTAIAALMGYVNVLQEWQGRVSPGVWAEAVRTLLLMLAPLAPHLSEELWAQRGLLYSIHQQPWPAWDPELAAEETVTLVVQVDGRVRARIAAPADIDEEAARRLALENPKVQGHLDGRPIRRIIYVPGRLVNVVTG
jgi:leucyl-tRNA synthetase